LEQLSFRIEEEIKVFDDKQKLKQPMATKPALQKILKETQHREEENKWKLKIWGRK
jgi:hypothetical protein